MRLARKSGTESPSLENDPTVGGRTQTIESIIPDEMKQQESKSTTPPPFKLQFDRYQVFYLLGQSIRQANEAGHLEE